MSQPPGFGGPSPQGPNGPQHGGPAGQGGPQGQQWGPQGQQWGPGGSSPAPGGRQNASNPPTAPQPTGGSHDAGATQFYPTAPGAGGQPDFGNSPEGEPRNTKKIAIIVGAAALALVLIVVGAVLFNNYQKRVSEERAAEAARIAEQERQAEETRQEAAAGTTSQGFLDALSQSDAEKALGYAAAPPEGNTDLMSRDVLFEANKRAALTGVAVDETILNEESPGVWNTGTAKVRYSIGDQPQTVDLPLRKVNGEWKIDQVSAPVELGLNGPDRLVNGVTVPPGAYNLFPGSYSVTSTNPLVGLDRTEFVLTSPIDPQTDWAPEPVLSDEGRNRSIEAGRKLVNDCMNVKELAPENCPFIRWREDGLTIDKSSLRYTLKNDPFQNVEFRFNGETMTASATIEVTHEIQASATRNGQRGTLVPQTQTNPAGLSVKLGSGTPEASFT